MHTENVAYCDLDTELEGYVAYDSAVADRRPAVLVAHAWAGQSDFERAKAEALARLGYVGFALDLYGKGVLGGGPEENARLMQPFLDDRSRLRQRMRAGLDVVRDLDVVDPERVAVIGFCFGGLCALDMARDGAPVRAAIAFHGFLSGAEIVDEPREIRAKVLALHGREDPFVPPDQVEAFAEEMTAKKADWQLHVFGNTWHAFTHRAAEAPELGNRYDAAADRRSWQAMRDLLDEVFG